MSVATARSFKFRKQPPDRCTYHIQIDDWSVYYAFGDNEVEAPERFSEVSNLMVMGALIAPVLKKYTRCAVTFHLMAVDMETTRRPEQRFDIGEIYRGDGILEASVLARAEGAHIIIAGLAASRIDTLLLFGSKLRYGNATVDSFVFKRKGADDQE